MKQIKDNIQLTNELSVLRREYEALLLKVAKLESELTTKPKLSDIIRSEEDIKNMIKKNSEDITRLEKKLAMIQLPDEPRYYLTKDELTNFQTNFSKLLAMITAFEQLYNNIIAYLSTIKQ